MPDDGVLEHDGKAGADYSGSNPSGEKRTSPRPNGTSQGEDAPTHEAASAFSDAFQGQQFEVKDPGEVTDRSHWTPTQVEQWDHMLTAERRYFDDLAEYQDGDREGADVRKPLIADLGGVGSGKSFTGAGLIAPRQVQVYDGSIGLFCANTREQTEQTLIPRFKEGMAMLGFGWERATYHKSIMFRGQVYKHTIAIELSDGTYSFIRIGSFASADRLESEEFDWGILSEIQSADELAFKKVRRRIRTPHANALVFAEGTPRKESHWQYDSLPEMGFDVWMSDTRDNPHKQPGYASELMSMYGKARAEAMVKGHPIEISTDAVFYEYDQEQHRSAAPAEWHEYDRNAPLYIFIDFNLSPMSIAVFQPRDGSDVGGFADEAYAQIDEFEVWQGGTRQAMREVYDTYSDHTAGGLISGDGSESKDTTSPDKTDWDIVKAELGSKMPMMRVQPGTYQADGSDDWINPPVRDRINAGNWFLMDGRGKARVALLPESEFESGGLPASVSEVEKDEEGKIDKSIDKTDDRDATQSHFSDVFSYFAYDRARKSGNLGAATTADEALDRLESALSTSQNPLQTGRRDGSFADF